MWERHLKGRSVYISREVSRESEAEGWSGPTLFPSTGNEGSQLGQLNGVKGWVEKEMSQSADELGTRKLSSSNAIKNWRQRSQFFREFQNLQQFNWAVSNDPFWGIVWPYTVRPLHSSATTLILALNSLQKKVQRINIKSLNVC